MSNHLLSLLFGLLLFASPGPVPRPHGSGALDAPAAVTASADARGDGPWWRARKNWNQVLGCFAAILGVGGVLLVFATGPVVPLLGALVFGLAMEICG